MYKPIATLLLSMSAMMVQAQSLSMQHEKPDGAFFEKLVQVPGKDAKEIYQNALAWFEASFPNHNAVITSKSPGKKITAASSIKKGISAGGGIVGDLGYQLQLHFEDGSCTMKAHHMKFNGSFPVERYIFSESGVDKGDAKAKEAKASSTKSVTALFAQIEKGLKK